MSDVDVLAEILDWSPSRPPWQRDALRRLVTKGEVSDDDVNELAEVCKGSYGLTENCNPEPLEAKHLPDRGTSIEPLRLKSLTHHDGVNALAKDQTIEFGPSLTVVYGANAAGKSGYTRILKQACRARGAEDILGNVVADTAPGRPLATLQYDIGDESKELLWGDDEADSAPLGRISVFDRHCESVYIGEKTDVAFRPLGLDLFDKLADACETVRNILENERKLLTPPANPIVPDVSEGTVVDKLISHITSLTDQEVVKRLATFSDGDRSELEALRNRLRDANAADPEKAAKVLDLRAKRIEWLAAHAANTASFLADEVVHVTYTARDKMVESTRLAQQTRAVTFGEQPLPHTGSDAWRDLWAAAERFSIDGPYPDRPFPVTDADARCVLCQQELSATASERFKAFQEFLVSAVQQEHDKSVRAYQQHEKRLKELVISNEETSLAIEELKVEDQALADAVSAFLESSEERRKAIVAALDEGIPCPTNMAAAAVTEGVLTTQVNSLRERADHLRSGTNDIEKKKLQSDLAELTSREQLAKYIQPVLDEITRQKKVAAYQLALEETKTNAITRKSSDVTERAVTKQLAKSFADELKALRFTHIEVELTVAGGTRGALFHRLQLKRAPGVSVPKVVSEGEARCLSIASFFAELSTTTDRSAILFDDPVSSLDHNWRNTVAHRLAVESQTRQVIVFTHDIVFLLTLIEHVGNLGIELKHQHLRRDRTGAGRAEKQLPWAAMKVKDRLGHLRALHQDAESQHRKGNQSAYELQAASIYGLLREAWERAVEEVLLGGVVERYRNSVQTQRAGCLSDITSDECDALEAAMTKTSRWLPGHDQAPAENAPCPDPDELKQDIQALHEWVQALRPRR